jgi:protein phosphatase
MLRVAEHFERTDTGRARRANEDSYFARAPLFAVADGMGGAQAGEVASSVAVEVLEQGLPGGVGSVEERLARRVAEANARINELSQAEDARAGMGTTLTAAYVGEHDLTVAHVGDSRLYRLRGGELERLTEDHSLVEELVRQGRLSPEEASEHPQRSIITRALGPEAGVVPDTQTVTARDGDVYLICSDGLTSMVPEGRVAEVLAAEPSLAHAGRALVDAANAAGGRDNITVVLFRLEDVEAVGAGAAAGPGAAAADQATATGLAAASASAPPAPASASAPAVRPAGVRRREPQPPATPPAPPRARSRRLRIAGAVAASVAVLALLGLGFWFASQTVYFVGVSEDGFVAVHRGLPYDLPLGLDLYTVTYESSVPVAWLRRPGVATEHKLRSRDDALDLVRRLETGEVR